MIVVGLKKKNIMNIKMCSKEQENLREDQIALLFLYCFDLFDDYSKYTSGEIRAMLYEMEDSIE